jgi:hypothetical protein
MSKSSKSKTNTEVRVFTGGDAAMLTSLSVIMGVATTPAIKTFLLSKRGNWNAAFFKSLTDAITTAFKDVLGIDNKGGQVTASKELYKAMEEVKPKLRSFKTQVEIDFEDDNREQQILSSLGFDLWSKVQKDNQEALVELLSQFTKNMTVSLQNEIVAAGTDVSYITTIKSYADIIRDKNIAQEGKKKDKKTVTSDGVKQLNKVYSDVMKVAKTATALYIEADDKLTAEKFGYNKTLATLTNGAAKANSKKATTAVTETKK